MGRLHVILQGLFAVQDTGPGIEMVLPAVNGHVYRAGNWLAESEIKLGSSLQLEGVDTTGRDSFLGKDFIIQVPQSSLTSAGRAVTIGFPYKPKEILGLMLAQGPAGSLVVKSMTAGQASGNVLLATACVMIFDFSDENGVRLSGHPWQPYSVDDSICLHLISTSENAEPWLHNQETNVDMAKVINPYPGYEFPFPRLSPPDWRWSSQIAADYGNLGSLDAVGDYFVDSKTGKFAFSQRQLESFELRQARLSLMGRLVQQRRPIESAWNSVMPMGIHPANCAVNGTSYVGTVARTAPYVASPVHSR